MTAKSRVKYVAESLAEIIGSLIGMAIALTMLVIGVAFVLLILGKLVGLI